jgi:hypothetical protein
MAVMNQAKFRSARAAIFSVAAVAGAAQAFTLDTGNPDIEARWDTQVRYNLGVRVEGRDSRIANNPIYDESDYKFDRGDLINNRLDVFSEFDFSYRKKLGFRVSAAGWFDAAYSSQVKTNPAFAGQSSYNNDRYSSFTKRFYRGPSGELLDAFVFANQDLGGGKSFNVKLGQHAIYWGESVFDAFNSIAYSQAPLDGRKSLTSPGIEAKEAFLPINQISAQLQLRDDFSVSAQYFLDWKANRLPEGGTYFGGADFLFDGPDRFGVAPGFFLRRADSVTPDKKRGDWGLSAKWSPAWLDGTLGFYYRKFDERQPFAPEVNPAGGFYRLVYPRDTELFGISLGKNIGGVAVGAELVRRRNTAFNGIGVNSATLEGPRGNSTHAVLNGTLLTNLGKWANNLVIVGELVWNHWDKVTKNPELFNGLGFAGCLSNDAVRDACATKNYYGANLLVIPKWLQVYPGLDMSMPVSLSYGLKGNAATLGGGNHGAGSYSIGLSFDYLNKYTLDIKYIDYLVRYRDIGGVAATVNGAAYSDRGLLAATFKTTF